LEKSSALLLLGEYELPEEREVLKTTLKENGLPIITQMRVHDAADPSLIDQTIPYVVEITKNPFVLLIFGWFLGRNSKNKISIQQGNTTVEASTPKELYNILADLEKTRNLEIPDPEPKRIVQDGESVINGIICKELGKTSDHSIALENGDFVWGAKYFRPSYRS